MATYTQTLRTVRQQDFERLMSVLARYSIHIVLIGWSLACLLPLLLVVSASFTDEIALTRNGYGLFPSQFSTDAYTFVLQDPTAIVRAYGVTIFNTLVGTVLGVLVMSMLAYPLSQPDFRLRRPLSFFVFFTMLFNGGIVPFYILMTQYLRLRNNVLALIIPHLVGVWYVLILRTYFAGLPRELLDAARVDGAGEWRIFFSIVLPLSKPALATIGLFVALGIWNDWILALYFISDANLYPLQYLLQILLANASVIANMRQLSTQEIPLQTMRMAMAVLATGPAAIFFLFFQKYLVRGITLGSFK
jgi:putative aldouronate transport system permease protein